MPVIEADPTLYTGVRYAHETCASVLDFRMPRRLGTGGAPRARARGARVVLAPGAGLNGAVETGVAVLGELGHGRVIVAHGDLPLAGPMAWLSRSVGVTLVPDHRDDGTNVACIPTHAGFRFSYGPGSLARHEPEGRRLGLSVRIVRDPLLARDVDEPADLLGLEIV